MKNVLILSSSPRKDGNSDLLCQEFFKGAREAGHSVELVRIAEKKIGYCQACYACTRLGKCFQQDDMNELAAKMEQADVIVLATPVYFYSMSGQLKVFIDRLVPNYTKIHADIYLSPPHGIPMRAIWKAPWKRSAAARETALRAARKRAFSLWAALPKKATLPDGKS